MVCCDGTNNTLTAGLRDTNVMQLHQRLRAERERRLVVDPNGPDQVLYYDPGVGAAVGLPPTGLVGAATNGLRRVAGLALGSGVHENIGQAYLNLCREYGRGTPDGEATTDEIWLFGFSRGAFTVRAVAGMVNLFGLIRPEHEPLLPTLLRVYFAGADDQRIASPAKGHAAARVAPLAGQSERALGTRVDGQIVRAFQAGRGAISQEPAVMLRDDPAGEAGQAPAEPTRSGVAAQIRREFTSERGREARIHFTGVWDTVDSVGLLPGARKKISSAPTIHDKRFTHVRHALALDEHRRQFLPRYFDGRVSEGQTLRQVWFRGVHSDIGGNRRAGDSLLSFETLAWMIDEAIDCGLRVAPLERDRDPATIVEVIGDQLRAQPAWALTGMALRDPARAPGTGHVGPLPADPVRAAALLSPREHGSVKVFSADGPGGTGPGAPRSPWEPGNGPRAKALAILVALTAGLGWACLVMAGALATPGPAGLGIGRATEAGWRLFWDQIGLLWPSMSGGVHELGVRLHPAEVRFERWAAADRDGAQASYGWAQLFVVGFTFCVASLAARGPARAFGRITRWRGIRDPYPRPHGLMNALGLGFAVMVLAFAAQTAALILAWDVGRSAFRPPLLALASEAAVVSGIGAALTAALLMGWIAREVVDTFRSAGRPSGRSRRT
ncbi:MAG: DUF2235 domain-containing protein [Solirubrobacteraceae bacterium]|nr:DUF2235 domain-containing protein [Solirubrobacteraceae bacterium]